jgi:hypothetical protein
VREVAPAGLLPHFAAQVQAFDALLAGRFDERVIGRYPGRRRLGDRVTSFDGADRGVGLQPAPI